MGSVRVLPSSKKLRKEPQGENTLAGRALGFDEACLGWRRDVQLVVLSSVSAIEYLQQE
jgi:hypothetical protein